MQQKRSQNTACGLEKKSNLKKDFSEQCRRKTENQTITEAMMN